MPLRLTIGFSNNWLVQPLRDGTVKPKNIELDFVTMDSGTLFYRNLKVNEFDVSEMGIPWTVRIMNLRREDRWHWAKLPIFLSRGTGWANLYVDTGSGINNLADLKGKRVCVPEYNMSICMWLRVMLEEFHGITPMEIDWFNGRRKNEHQGGVLGVEEDRPRDIRLRWLPPHQTPDESLERGELDAAVIMGDASSDSIDRYGNTRWMNNPKIRKLFPDDGMDLIRAFYDRTGAFQLNHHVIIQRRLVEKHPWIVEEIFNAFQRSKEAAYQTLQSDDGGNRSSLKESFARERSFFGSDPYPLGLTAMRRSFDRYIQAMLDGKVIDRRFSMDEVYHPATHAT